MDGKLSAGTAVEVYNEAFRVGSATTTILRECVVGLGAEIGLSFDLVVGSERLGFPCNNSCEGFPVLG